MTNDYMRHHYQRLLDVSLATMEDPPGHEAA